MEHRAGDQADRVFLVIALGIGGHAAGQRVLVAQHHPLRPAGGAAGIEDAVQILAGAAGVRRRIVLPDHVLIAGQVGGRPVGHAGQFHMAAHLGLQLAAHLLHRLVDEQQDGAGILQGVGQFRQAPAQIHRHHHAAGPRDGGKQLHVAVG